MRSGWSRSRRGASQALLQRLDLLGNGGLGEIALLHGRDSPHGARHGAFTIVYHRAEHSSTGHTRSTLAFFRRDTV